MHVANRDVVIVLAIAVDAAILGVVDYLLSLVLTTSAIMTRSTCTDGLERLNSQPSSLGKDPNPFGFSPLASVIA